jgi:hypothetical protein
MMDVDDAIALSSLESYLEILDTKITNINEEIQASPDAANEGLYDKAEYFIGAGFVALQKHILEYNLLSCPQNEKLYAEKEKNFDIGPKDENGTPIARIIQSAANYWKHEGEWWVNAVHHGPPDTEDMHADTRKAPKNGRQQSWYKKLEPYGRFGSDYICANVLYQLTKDTEAAFKLQSLLPLLETWRAEVGQRQSKPQEN